MQAVYLVLYILSIITEIYLESHITLEPGEFILMGFKAVYQRKHSSI